MKKIGLLARQFARYTIEETLRHSKGLFILHYCGLSASELDILRKDLYSINSRLFVSRNRPAKNIFQKKEPFKELVRFIEGPTAFVFVKDNPIVTAKKIVNFTKEHQNLVFDAAILENKILEKAKIKHLAALPSKEILIAQLLQMIKTPISGLLYSMHGIVRKLVLVLKEIENTKQSEKSQG